MQHEQSPPRSGGQEHEVSACSCSWVPGQGYVSNAGSLLGSLPENTPSHLSQECLVSGEFPDYSWLDHGVRNTSPSRDPPHLPAAFLVCRLPPREVSRGGSVHSFLFPLQLGRATAYSSLCLLCAPLEVCGQAAGAPGTRLNSRCVQQPSYRSS